MLLKMHSTYPEERFEEKVFFEKKLIQFFRTFLEIFS